VTTDNEIEEKAGEQSQRVTLAKCYSLTDSDGNTALFWFAIPDGMSRDQAAATQSHYGPFTSRQEVNESMRVVLLGEQCKVIEGGAWDFSHQQ